jgi:hypothetical protein
MLWVGAAVISTLNIPAEGGSAFGGQHTTLNVQVAEGSWLWLCYFGVFRLATLRVFPFGGAQSGGLGKKIPLNGPGCLTTTH